MEQGRRPATSANLHEFHESAELVRFRKAWQEELQVVKNPLATVLPAGMSSPTLCVIKS